VCGKEVAVSLAAADATRLCVETLRLLGVQAAEMPGLMGGD
jgi:hypothetical protein